MSYYDKIKRSLKIINKIPNADIILDENNLAIESCGRLVFDNLNDYELFVKTVDLWMDNIIRLREKSKRTNGIGYLYLDEVCHALYSEYTGDRNIGITTNNMNWHIIDFVKEISCGKLDQCT